MVIQLIMKKIISTNNMNNHNSPKLIKYLRKHYLKDAEKLGYTLSDLLNIKTRAKIIKEIERGDTNKPVKVLSKRYLNDAKRLGYTWMDLYRKATRNIVIDKVIKLRMKEAIEKAQMDSFKQTVTDIKQERKMKKIRKFDVKQKTDDKKLQKQTADVLIFQR